MKYLSILVFCFSINSFAQSFQYSSAEYEFGRYPTPQCPVRICAMDDYGLSYTKACDAMRARRTFLSKGFVVEVVFKKHERDGGEKCHCHCGPASEEEARGL